MKPTASRPPRSRRSRSPGQALSRLGRRIGRMILGTVPRSWCRKAANDPQA